MPGLNWLSLLVAALLVLLLPFLFGELMLAGLAKLHVSPEVAIVLMFAIIIGGLVNIPVKRIVRQEEVIDYPLSVYGFRTLWPERRRVRRESIIAVNLGGCVIPTGLALYEVCYLFASGSDVGWAIVTACIFNAAVCYFVAHPEPDVGIVMPSLLSPLTAAILASMLAPDQAPPVAFIAGITGPLVGADLLHLKDIGKIAVGTASIGGAGTFDGIVLSGIVAAYLA
jgi:uncharacterized membrane protein